MLQEYLEPVVFFSTVLLVGGVAVLLGLIVRTQHKLKTDYTVLCGKLEGQVEDIRSLCSAAVSVDERMLEYDQRLKALAERLESLDRCEQVKQPYFEAIQEAQRGLGADELASRCGLTLDEAKLLVRLYQPDGRRVGHYGAEP